MTTISFSSNILDRNSSAIINSTPVMSIPQKIAVFAQEIPNAGEIGTSWGGDLQTTPGGFAVCYGFAQEDSGKIFPDNAFVERNTFLGTYSPQPLGETFNKLNVTPNPKIPVPAYKARALHNIFIPEAEYTQISGKEGLQNIPEGHVVIADPDLDPYTNKPARALGKFEPIKLGDVDRSGRPFTQAEIEASEQVFGKIKQVYNL